MSPRDTRTGTVFEQLAKPVLEANGYKVTLQSVIGSSIGGGKHRADIVIIAPNSKELLVSMKWQQTSGTAEEKVPFEIIKLIHAVKNSSGRFQYAYLVLGGTGWKPQLKTLYLNGGLRDAIIDYDFVRVVSLDDFIGRANRKLL